MSSSHSHVSSALFCCCSGSISFRSVPFPCDAEKNQTEDDCYIQFFDSSKSLTLGTAIAAFYVPVAIMIVLYWRVWRETENRQKDLVHLQAGKKNDSHRSNSRYLDFNYTIISMTQSLKISCRRPCPPPPLFLFLFLSLSLSQLESL